jgi:hypothetical protein
MKISLDKYHSFMTYLLVGALIVITMKGLYLASTSAGQPNWMLFSTESREIRT